MRLLVSFLVVLAVAAGASFGMAPANAAPSAAATSDLVIPIPVPDWDLEAAQEVYGDLHANGATFNDVVEDIIRDNPHDAPDWDKWASEMLASDIDGSVRLTAEGIEIVIPADEVHAEIATWAVVALVAATTYASFMVYVVGCLAVAPEAAYVCKTFAASMAAMTARLVGGVLIGEDLSTPFFWATMAAAGVAGALGGPLVKYVEDWAKVSAQPTAIAIGRAMVETAKRIQFWFRVQVVEPMKSFAQFLADVGSEFYQALLDAVKRPPRGRSLRVMPMGDSITYGIGSTTTSSYRADLMRDLTASGHTVDFVGSQNSGQLTDTDNEGHNGWEISDLTGIAKSMVAAYRPNVVTLHIGSNDLNNNADVAGAPDRLARLIDDVQAASPDTTVIVASVVANRNPVVQERINAFNAKAAQLVAARKRAGRHVRMVDMSAVTTTDLIDGLHPNDAGYAKMATSFLLGIQAAVRLNWVTAPQPPATSAGCTVPRGWIPKNRIASGVGADPAHIRFADINGDGRDDYLVLDDDGAVDAWINNGGDTPGGAGWIKRGRIASGVGSYPAQIQFADINGDGRDDYLVVTTGGAVNAWINNGGDTPEGRAGWIKRGQIASGVGSGSLPIRFADVDGDGRDDYLVLQRDNSVLAWINKGGDTPGGPPGWYQRGQIASGVTTTSRIDFADVDGDGRDDYLTINATGAVKAWVNKGGDTPGGPPGWYERGQIASGTGAPGDQVRFGDMNAGDSMDDYLVLKPDGALYAWQNNCGDPA